MDQLNKLSGIAHWLPRLSLAAIFIYHGFPKIAMTGDVAAMMGMPFIMVLMVGIFEVGASLLMLWGGVGPDWATRIAGLVFIAVMVGAITMVHFPAWLEFSQYGYRKPRAWNGIPGINYCRLSIIRF